MTLLFAVAFWMLALSAQAAELVWDSQTITSPLTVERSATQAGPFSTIATLPTGTTRYMLTPGAYGWYRVGSPVGPSNVVQFSLDLYTGLVTDRLNALETTVANHTTSLVTLQALPMQIMALAARVSALEATPIVIPPPAPTSNLTVRQIDADHIEITCNGIGISTTGAGLQRVLTCKH